MGTVPAYWIADAERRLAEANIVLVPLDLGDAKAGHASCPKPHGDEKRLELFEVGVNKKHEPAIQVVTLLHELAHFTSAIAAGTRSAA